MTVLLLPCVAVYVQTLILTVTSNTNEAIYCNAIDDCIIDCSHYGICALSLIYCNNATKCTINCTAQQSCSGATIYHTNDNQEIEINCSDEDSCSLLRVQYEDDLDVVMTHNKSLQINSFSARSSLSMSLSDTATFSQTTINCASELSCQGLDIEINMPKSNVTYTMKEQLRSNLNINCVGVESCKYMRLNVADEFETVHSPIEWANFTISLYCNDSRSCQYAVINAAKLKINAIKSSLSFGDLFVYCNEIDESCLYTNIICPDLIRLGTMYDYLYQTSKCHISFLNSYENIVTIISKHGARMIDIDCDHNDDSICDGITIYCTEDTNSYYCRMQYNLTGNNWFCNNYDIYYDFPSNYSYGCDEYIWLDTIAIIETSKIPNYKNETLMSCAKFNPSSHLNECYMRCDLDYSCKSDFLCDDATICHIECNALMSCQAIQPSSSKITNIRCPSDIVGSLCSIIINQGVPSSKYGQFLHNYRIWGYNATSVMVSISHNMIMDVYDLGMKYANITILNSDDLPNWSKQYDTESWWRIYNYPTDNIFPDTPVTMDILCDRCYTDWLKVADYDYFSRNVSINLSCRQCSGTEAQFWGITSFEFDCYHDCSYSSITLTDSNANLNCHHADSCHGINVYLNPSNYSSYLDNRFEYNVNLFDTSSDISLYSLFGFQQLEINNPSSDDITFHCGYPDYFNEYHDYNEINNTMCSNVKPTFSSAVVALFEWQYVRQMITAEMVYCSLYGSCYGSKIHCSGTDCVVHCDGVWGCMRTTIYTNSTQNSLRVYCADYLSCFRIEVYGNDIDYLEINCMAGDSCVLTTIYHSTAKSPSKGLNFTCHDKTKTAKVLPADDIYDFPACRTSNIYCPFSGCNINLIDSLYVDPYAINIYYAQGFAEMNLQCHFNALTNQSTCYDTNYYCNLPDNKDGDNATSYVYKSSFDAYTGDCIGQCCDYIFSHSPTAAPSSTPTLAPTEAPSESPSIAPTAAPTRFPTSFTFDAHFIAKFYIKVNSKLLTERIIYWIEDLKNAMEYGYLAASSTRNKYSEYMVSILNVSVMEINSINFTAKIFSFNDVVSYFAQFTENNADFGKTVADELEKRWNMTNITFDVYSGSIVEYKKVKEPPNSNESNITLTVLISFTICIWIIGFLSFLHTKDKLKCLNKLPSIKPCDDAQYMNVIAYGMQTLDLYSDIAFCWEIYLFSKTVSNDVDSTVITILYSLSFVFFLLPYSINLIFAVIFEKFMDNTQGADLSVYTRNYFAKYSKLFAVLVIVSGSVSVALKLINSSTFGHDFFHAGFSKYELSKMSKFRVLFTVLIENIPQFVIQLIYLIYFSGKDEEIVTFTFVVSTCSSIVSILSTIIAHFLQQKHIPRFQTKFNIEIVLVDDANNQLQFDRSRMESDLGLNDASKRKIDVRDEDVKKLHKRGNLRKIMTQNIAKCLGTFSDNFELLYCVEQIDGLTFHGVCSSNNDTLYALFEQYENELTEIVKKIYQLNYIGNKYWKIEFVAFDANGQNVGDQPDVTHAAIQLTNTNKENNKKPDGKTENVTDC